jgi:hypothetical protein
MVCGSSQLETRPRHRLSWKIFDLFLITLRKYQPISSNQTKALSSISLPNHCSFVTLAAHSAIFKQKSFPVHDTHTGRNFGQFCSKQTSMSEGYHVTDETLFSANNAIIALGWHTKLNYFHCVDDPKTRTNFVHALSPVILKFQMRLWATDHPQ